MNLPPINANLQHSSAVIPMSAGDLVPSMAPCPCNLNTYESKHWQSLCDACNISYACMTQHAILRHAYDAFNGRNSLVKGLSTLIKHYVTSTTTHCTPRSGNCIGHNCNPSFGLRSCPPSFLKQTTTKQASNTAHPIN